MGLLQSRDVLKLHKAGMVTVVPRWHFNRANSIFFPQECTVSQGIAVQHLLDYEMLTDVLSEKSTIHTGNLTPNRYC